MWKATIILQFLALSAMVFNEDNGQTEAAYDHRFGNGAAFGGAGGGGIGGGRGGGASGNQLLTIALPKIYLGDFEYVPTREGYRFSYQLLDGTRRTEVGIIPGAAESGLFPMDSRSIAERLRSRPRGQKNRKLSPKSLQSLAG